MFSYKNIVKDTHVPENAHEYHVITAGSLLGIGSLSPKKRLDALSVSTITYGTVNAVASQGTHVTRTFMTHAASVTVTDTFQLIGCKPVIIRVIANYKSFLNHVNKSLIVTSD